MILLLCSASPDYLQDLTYAGLAQVLGKEQVVEHPPRPEFHRPAPYPLGCGFVPGPARGATWDEVVALARDGRLSLVVVGACKPEPLRALAALREAVPDLPPQVFVDGGDHAGLGADAPDDFARVSAARPFDLAFKRELPRGAPPPPRTHPLTFSVNLDAFPALPEAPRPHALFLAFRNTAPIRGQLAAAAAAAGLPNAGDGLVTRRRPGVVAKLRRSLRKRLGLRHEDGYIENLAHTFRATGDDYLRRLASSRVAVSARGAGFDTLRYWEVPACGAMLLSERPTIEIPDDFEDGRSAVFFDGVDDFVDKARRCCADLEAAARIAAAGQQRLRDHHTTRHRAAYVLATVERELGVVVGAGARP
ncbi:MAG: glycosyltransferase family 1 protein [Planctomycetes bacterium]|nr:glycosyltransferase family 1 protein [Planctomycetota bacterium]